MSDTQTVQTYTDAWLQAIEAVNSLVGPLPEAQWNLPTECPGWSVRDVVSHIIAIETELLGDPRPIHSLPRDLRHVKDDFARHIELPVDKRRCHTAPEMTGELEYTIIRRSRALRSDRYAPTDEVRWPMGPYTRDIPFHQLLRNRVFDVWTHEQDIRRALRVPGDLDTEAARITRDHLVGMLPKAVAKLAAAPPASVVAVSVTGPLEFSHTVRVDASGRGVLEELLAPAPDVRISTDWETYARLACGRIDWRRADVKVEGDEELAQRVLDNFSVTP